MCIEKTYYQTKNENFEQYHGVENVKEGPLAIFKQPVCCKTSKKMVVNLSETTKKFSLKKPNFEQSNSAEKSERETFIPGFFNIHSAVNY